MKTQFQRVLESRLNEAVESHRISVASGVCTDYAHYRDSVGYIRGLTAALRICEEIEGESK